MFGQSEKPLPAFFVLRGKLHSAVHELWKACKELRYTKTGSRDTEKAFRVVCHLSAAVSLPKWPHEAIDFITVIDHHCGVLKAACGAGVFRNSGAFTAAYSAWCAEREVWAVSFSLLSQGNDLIEIHG